MLWKLLSILSKSPIISRGYEYLIKKHLGLPVIAIYVAFILSSAKISNIGEAKTALSFELPYLLLIFGVLIIGYLNFFIESKNSNFDEISQMLTCTDKELELLIYSMRNNQRVISRYESFDELIQNRGSANLPNMFIRSPTLIGGSSSITIKPATFNYLQKSKLKIERLMLGSSAVKHIESKIGSSSLIITMGNENHSEIKFRDALSQMIKR
jgi:hypothetical protein